MRFENGFELNILPKLISIPELDIMKTIIVILLEGVEVNIPIIGEFICKAVITPVAITKKDKFRIVIKWDSLCIGIGPVQTFGRSHIRSEKFRVLYKPQGILLQGRSTLLDYPMEQVQTTQVNIAKSHDPVFWHLLPIEALPMVNLCISPLRS
jgi:hypothetical protein